VLTTFLYRVRLLHEDEASDSRAIAEYETCVKLNPGNEKAHFRLGRLYQKHRNTKAAAREFRAYQETKMKQREPAKVLAVPLVQ
jgi:hypothetical protein